MKTTSASKKSAGSKHPLAPREHPDARDERGSASRDEIRSQTGRVPAARQSRSNKTSR